MKREYISEQTGFDLGERFTSEDQVRAYFTVDSMVEAFGPEDGAALTQGDLDDMADAVIAHRWHCAF